MAGHRNKSRGKWGEMSDPLPPVMYKIAVGVAIGRAYRTVFGNWRLAIALAWRPFLIIVLIDLFAPFLLTGINRILALGLHPIVLVIFGSIFIVRWHRFILLGEIENNGLFPPGWRPFFVSGSQLALLFLASIVVFTISFAIAVHNLFSMSSETIRPLPRIFLAAGFTWFFISIFLSVRVCLVFPAAAVERPIGFPTAWSLLTGNYWRLVICIVVCYLPFDILESIVAERGAFGVSSFLRFLFIGLPSARGLLFRTLELGIGFAGFAVLAALISDAYRGITGEGREGIASAFN